MNNDKVLVIIDLNELSMDVLAGNMKDLMPAWNIAHNTIREKTAALHITGDYVQECNQLLKGCNK